MTLYEKRGRRYVPVRDTHAYSGLCNGSWLVTVERGMTSVQQAVEPDHAGFLAAARIAEDAMAQAIVTASAMTPRARKHTPKEKRAFKAYQDIMGDDVLFLSRAAASEVARIGIKAVEDAFKERTSENRTEAKEAS